jgi:hypothetical protein
MDKNRRAFGEIATSSSDIWLALKRLLSLHDTGAFGAFRWGANYRIALKYRSLRRPRCLANSTERSFLSMAVIMNLMTQVFPPRYTKQKKPDD